MYKMVNPQAVFKRKYLKTIVYFRRKKYNKLYSGLSEEQRIAFNIAIKLMSSPSSVLEVHPKTNELFVINGLKFVKIDNSSVTLVNGKYFYFFSYDYYLIRHLYTVFARTKELLIKEKLNGISKETTHNLREIYAGLTQKSDEKN